MGKTVTLKLKLDTFEVRTRSQTLPDFTCSPTAIFQCAQDILRDEMRIEAERSKLLTLRLMGSPIKPQAHFEEAGDLNPDSGGH
ncbi:unnamed protein product [Dibothriocephalus latus]|uniref:DNA polymerase Y-family little finger domain-containing protein n=1 Tax=Dibothriocephalus latus TaxID=60516 RepID=A0A3P7MR71_DIBLA|nr:unnamed protein product [Dibothriocephalus latus]